MKVQIDPSESTRLAILEIQELLRFYEDIGKPKHADKARELITYLRKEK